MEVGKIQGGERPVLVPLCLRLMMHLLLCKEENVTGSVQRGNVECGWDVGKTKEMLESRPRPGCGGPGNMGIGMF